MAVLASYAYLKEGPFLDFMHELNKRDVPTMLDSGAFTAYTLGKPIALAEYIAFCKAHGSGFTHYVQLDKIKDKAASKKWLDEMFSHGLKPMPVFTVDDDEADFMAMLAKNEFVCIAGNPTSAPRTWGIGNSRSYPEAKAAYEARFERFWRMSQGRAKMHGLSFTRGIAPWKHRCYSVDSSTWANGQRYGKIMMFSPTKGCNQHPWRKYAKAKFFDLDDDVAKYFIKCGVKIEELLEKESSSSSVSMIQVLSADAWLSYCLASREHGVTFYFATANIDGMAGLALASKHRLNGGGVDWVAVKAEIPAVREMLKAPNKTKYIDFLCDALEPHLKDASRS